MKRAVIFLGLALALAFAGLASAQTVNPFLIPREYAPERGRPGGTLTLGFFGGVATLNPFVSRDPRSGEVISTFLNAPLVMRFIDNVWRPYAAESFVIAPDSRSITYTLRRGLRWSDGQPLTAEDYVLTFNLHANREVNSHFYSATYVGDAQTRVVKVDDYTLRFEFGEIPHSPVAKSNFRVVPAHVFGPVFRERGAAGVTAMWTVHTPPAQLPSITAWRMTSFVQNERITWERNPNFDWVRLEVAPDDRLPYLEGFTQVIATANQSLALFLGGTTAEFAPRSAEELRLVSEARAAGRLDIQVFPNYSPAASSQFITFNFNHIDPWKANLFRNVNFRRAMSHLTNREAMVEAALGGLGRPLHSPIYPVFAHIYREFVTFDLNPERAAELLRGLGFTRRDHEGWLIDDTTGSRLEFDLTTNSGNLIREAIGRIFAAEAAKIGVKVNFRTIDFGALAGQLQSLAMVDGRRNDRGWEAIIIGLVGGDPDQPIAGHVWQIGAPLHMWNMYRAGDPGATWEPWEIEIDRLARAADKQPDDAKRTELIMQFQRVAQENQPKIQTISPSLHLAHITRLGGYFPAQHWNAFYGTAFRMGGAAAYNWFLR